jgi:transposase
MKLQPITEQFADQDLFIGIDIHLKQWTVCIRSKTREFKIFSQPPSATTLINYLHRIFPSARYHCVYEAGFSGFTAARQLIAAGIDCSVANPADIPKSDRNKVYKNDKNDARMLASRLQQGDIERIYIPTVEQVQDRSLVRMYRWSIKKQSRCKTQIRMYLHAQGHAWPRREEKKRNSYWSRAVIAQLGAMELETESGTFTLRRLLAELLFHRDQVLALTRAIRALARSDRYRDKVRLLNTVPGVKTLTAMVILTELIDIERFANSNKQASFVGLIPRTDSSGPKVTTMGLTPRKNGYLRHVLIESAWRASSGDPALLKVFENASLRMPRTRAIVVVARKLLNRIRKVLQSGEPYQKGMTAIMVESADVTR